MSNPRFDLVDIAQTLRSRRKLLLIVVLAASVLGGVFYLVGKKKYKAEADFIISNPLYADRNNLFRTRDTRFVDYFGGDDDIDRVLVIANSDTLRNLIASKLNLWKAYELKPEDPKDRLKMKEIFKDRFKMERTEYTTAKVYFTDEDAARAAEVVNLAIDLSENIFRGYYIKMKENVSNSIQERINEIDSSITSITGKLQSTQDRFEAENLEVVRKQLLEDKARNISLQNEFLTGVDANDRNRYIQVITPATPPAKPAGIGFVLTVIGSAFFGFFFCAIYILIITYYKLLIAVER